LQFSRPHTSSINCSPIAGPSIPRFPADDSVPSIEALGASLLPSSMKANVSWFLCRLSSMSHAARSRPCGELSLHLHQVVKGTFTPKLSNMLGTQKRCP
jgi:hypothetical protein